MAVGVRGFSAGREAPHSFPSGTDVNAWRYTSVLSYGFVACAGITLLATKQNDKNVCNHDERNIVDNIIIVIIA